MAVSRYLVLSVIGIALVLLAGCSQDAPAKTAEQFVNAMAANDLATLQDIVDPAVAEQVMMGIMLQAGLQAFVGGGSAEVIELETKTVTKDGTRATVSVSGNLKTNVLGTSLITPLDLQLNLIKIDGSWYVTE